MLKNRKVNLFLIGAMKSGSTSLHYHLADHPNIIMSDPKEPWYFVKERNWHRGENWYHSLFNGVSDSVKYIGESSADYTMLSKYQGVPERIAGYNSEARLIYVLRDPVMRSISHYWHNVRWHGEKRQMLDSFQQDHHLIEFSDYFMQLSAYLEHFDRDHIFILTFEELISQPEKIMNDIFSWLEVDNGFVPPSLYKAENVTPKTLQVARGLGLLNKFRHSYLWNKIHSYAPNSVISIGRKIAIREIDRKDQPADEAVDFLRPILREKTTPLQQYLARDFPEWKSL